MASVPRASVSPMDAGGWSPLKQGYVGTTAMAGGGAFGPEYVFSHTQSDHYVGSVPAYIEYIEVAIAVVPT